MEALRGWTSGLAVPHYVLDAPGGGGKVPLQPDYVLDTTPTHMIVRNYAGTIHQYPLPLDADSSSVPGATARL